MMSPENDKSRAEILAEQLATKKAAASKLAEEKAEALKVEQLEQEILAIDLEEKFTREIGRRGDKWEMFTPIKEHVSDGLIAIKKPEKIAWNTFEDSEKTKTDAHHLILSALIHPTKEQFAVVAGGRPALIWHVLNLCGKLVGVEKNIEAGK